MPQIVFILTTLLISNIATYFLTRKKYVTIIRNAYTDKGTGKFGIYENDNLRSCSIEVEELEKAQDRTKVRIINIYGGTSLKAVNSFLQTKNGSAWVSTKFIKWNDNATQMVRNKKLDEIISEK